ncbi:MAG: ribosome small subunit-dependent GTPase A [Chitinophagaceae bacterium]|nr:ribosome small subunit-dependent GTPase A [Chitinophagaceae bacterium]
MKATVYKSTGSWYNLKASNGEWYQGRIRGVLKLDDITSTNPIAVGDHVEMEVEDEVAKTAIILSIDDRHNYINRQSPRAKHQHHIVAANLDQSVLVATLKEPRTSQGFIDRFLVASEMYHVKAIVVFNKSDIYKKKELEQFEKWKDMYERAGYEVLMCSAATGEGMDELKSHLKDKVSLFSGHSGVGKSSLMNAIMPELALRTKDVSGWSGKGMHTTTFAEMFDLPDGGSIIDTPGMREFGLVDVSREELSHYFPEIRRYIGQCQFNNCIHINEPGCAVKKAVVSGDINEDRFVSYVGLLNSMEEEY